MASSVALALNENNDEEVNLVITTNVPTPGTALNVTGLVVEAFLKVSAATSDVDGSTWKGSTATGEVTVTDGPGGAVAIAIPAAAISTGKAWWRCDVISAGKRKTAIYGAVTVTDL